MNFLRRLKTISKDREVPAAELALYSEKSKWIYEIEPRYKGAFLVSYRLKNYDRTYVSSCYNGFDTEEEAQNYITQRLKEEFEEKFFYANNPPYIYPRKSNGEEND